MSKCTFLVNMLNYYETDEEQFDKATENKLVFLKDQSKIKIPIRLGFEDNELNCLHGCSWLNDGVLNAYLKLLKYESEDNVGCTNSFFFTKLSRDGPAECMEWEGIKGRPLNIFDKFLVPVCAGVHWILICLNFIKNELQVLDPLFGHYPKQADLVNRFIEYQGLSRLSVTYPHCPAQRNGYDCGVFLLSNARCIFFNGGRFDFSQSDIPKIRRRIHQELLTKKLIF